MKLSVVLNPVPGSQELLAAGNPPALYHEAASIGSEVVAQEIADVVLASQMRPLTISALSGVARAQRGARDVGADQVLPLSVDLEMTGKLPAVSLLAPRR